VIKLVVADAVQAHRGIRRDHEIECGAACLPAINKWCRSPRGAICLLLMKLMRTNPHVACLQLEQLANLICC
jgi:hypothetical protein